MVSPSAKEAVLIHFSGHDAPGQTAALTGILAHHDVRILDVGQAVVHESLALGILVETAPGAFAAAKAELTQRAHVLGLHARFRVIRHGALEHWARTAGRDHFIITLLGRAITA